MRSLDVRELDVTCTNCHYDTVLNVDAYPDANDGIKRFKNGRLFVIPASEQTRVHGIAGNAARTARICSNPPSTGAVGGIYYPKKRADRLDARSTEENGLRFIVVAAGPQGPAG
jgi:hypothetical protein